MHAELPAELRPLEEIAHNLWWVWNEEAKAIFETMDPQEWEESGKNPVVLLLNLKSDTAERIIHDSEMMARIERVYRKFRDYM
ncbi:MAG: hypothetical protein XE13_0795, partial [Proteiniphilum sp. 51_7]